MVKSPAPPKKIHKVKKTKSRKRRSASKSPTQNFREKNKNAYAPKKSKKKKKTSTTENSSSDSHSTQSSNTQYPKEVITQSNTNQQYVTTPNHYPSNFTTSNITNHTLDHQNYNHVLQQQQQNFMYDWPQHPQTYSWQQQYPENYLWQQHPYNYTHNTVLETNYKPPSKPKSSEEALSRLNIIMQKQSEEQKTEAPNLSHDEFALSQKQTFGDIYIDPNTEKTHIKMYRTPILLTKEEEQRMRRYYQTDLQENHTHKHDYANPCKAKIFRCPTPICNYHIINSHNTEYHLMQHAKQFHTQNRITYGIQYNNQTYYYEYNPDLHGQEKTNLPTTCDNQNT